ncbi:response regulator [Flavobacterium sp. WC2509]|uniref:response regulator n=1 Tax=Flavobacterium sp. WC2509 TaxID=3461406 RepID=UPI0040449DE7
MNKKQYNLLLADDDEDDCLFFKEALDEIALSVTLITVNDGVQLLQFLSDNNLPDILFLDLNMPRKNGFECLTEIKKSEKLKDLAVIIFSTSFDINIVDKMYEKGATYYIQKPGDFNELIKVIKNALVISADNNFKQPERAQFVL